MSEAYAEIRGLFDRHGARAYTEEPVSQRDHALQTAALAVADAATPALVVAALVHDVGHLLLGMGEDRTRDRFHEAEGAAWLRRFFDRDVTDPVAQHVAAKRYLCAVEPAYAAGLSDVSTHTLALQGGVFGSEAARRFEQGPHWREAVRLRRWDDAAKVPGLAVPALDAYADAIATCVRRP